ncbi:MAG: roadblock/LC7 domain-containing protein [Anaerosomatales bacterium]
MSDEGIDKYLLGDIDDEMLDEGGEGAAPPVIVPPAPAPQAAPPAPEPPAPAPPAPAPQAQASPPPTEAPAAAPRRVSNREARLRTALEDLMEEASDIEAAALVSLDGFIIASALPEGMHEDRVGAMSAAILALGERAAAELGRSSLTQVFIEGADGYVLLVEVGGRAVLTVLARREAKLGLVLYDMRTAADTIAEILR